LSICKVSVIIPSFNCGPYLEAALGSVFNQAYPAYETIVVNDGSTDNTDEVLKPFLSKIHYIKQINKGLSKARNSGAEKASGDWFLFLDADDQLLPNALNDLVKYTKDERVGVVFGSVVETFPKLRKTLLRGDGRCAGDPPVPALENFWKSAIITSGAALIRKRAFYDAGQYRMPWTPTEDRDFWLRCGMLYSFRYSGTRVLDKLFREGSAISKVDKTIYWGMLVQFSFLEWCRERKLETSSLKITEDNILESALLKAFLGRYWDIVDDILNEADQRHILTPATDRIKKLKKYPHLLFSIKDQAAKMKGSFQHFLKDRYR
jgi:glycosyltransferase involved in cell wall biosynthesis